MNDEPISRDLLNTITSIDCKVDDFGGALADVSQAVANGFERDAFERRMSQVENRPSA